MICIQQKATIIVRTGQRDKQIDVFIHGRAEVGMDVAINRSRLDLAGLVCRDTLIFTFVKIKKYTPLMLSVPCCNTKSGCRQLVWCKSSRLLDIFIAYSHVAVGGGNRCPVDTFVASSQRSYELRRPLFSASSCIYIRGNASNQTMSIQKQLL